MNCHPRQVKKLEDIPFLPIQFFKSKEIIVRNRKPQIIFSSSGTTGMATSKHYVADVRVYEQSFRSAFQAFYGDPADYTILALLPSYLERKGSSLIYMVDDLIKQSKNENSGFYLHNLDELKERLLFLEEKSQKVLLIGVSYALLDLVEKYQFQLQHSTIMETGGMKGQRREMVKEELHSVLKKGFGINEIHSEYGMTELLSQAYSKGKGEFSCPPWMKILIRDPEEATSFISGKTGGINVIDLANIHSCAFIATQDLGKIKENGCFEVLGRFDESDIRGCNLMVV